jgi:EAL domain-containing protein (putative c-di-GMP-specific phosphodiesterase class I)
LRQFPVELLKIDKSFVDPLTDSSAEGAAFVRSIIRLAHSLGLRTVAEGIESQDQRRQLTSLGCDSAQGFLLGRPVDHRAAAEFVAARPGTDYEGPELAAPLVGHSE